MSEQHTWTYAKLIDRLSDEGTLDADQAQRARDHINDPDQAPIPTYIHALSGLGGVIASVMFVGLLGCMGIFESAATMLVFGGMMVIAATVARIRLSRAPNLLTQATLSAHLCGQALVVFGVLSATDGGAREQPAMLVYIAMAAVIYALDRSPVMRFIVSVIALMCAFGLVGDVLGYDSGDVSGGRLATLHVMHVALTAVVAVVFSGKLLGAKLRRVLGPLAGACVVGSLGLMWASVAEPKFAMHALTMRLTVAVPMALVLRQALIASASWRPQPATWAALASLCLAPIFSTGVLTGVLLLILGFWGARRSLIGAGVLALVGFLVHYYYTLQMTLLAKSGVLVGSGLLLIALWALLRSRFWHERVDVYAAPPQTTPQQGGL